MEITSSIRWCVLAVVRKYIYLKIPKNVHYSTLTDSFINHLMLEKSSKRESFLLNYFKNNDGQISKVGSYDKATNLLGQTSITILVKYLDSEFLKKECDIPNDGLNELLVYFSKNGHTDGVKAIQLFVEKYNPSYLKSQSKYIHYLGEAYWIKGNIDYALQLFTTAYDNVAVRPKINAMMNCLFPLLISENSEATLYRTIDFINRFCIEKNDYILLALLWRELFQSTWFSHQQLSKNLFKENPQLLHVIPWMIPSLGKQLLKSHRIEEIYRLIQFTLENNLKSYTGTLIRFLFDYYYIHQNIERCSSVVKYATHLDSALTIEQQRRYVQLLLKTKDSHFAKLNVKKPQNLKYKF